MEAILTREQIAELLIEIKSGQLSTDRKDPVDTIDRTKVKPLNLLQAGVASDNQQHTPYFDITMPDQNRVNSAKLTPEEIKELLGDDDSGNPSSEMKELPSASSDLSGSKKDRGLEFLYDVPLQISVEVGRSTMLLKELLKIDEGQVIELDKLAGEPLDLYVNSKLIAKGEAVMVGEKFGIRLTDIINTSERREQVG